MSYTKYLIITVTIILFLIFIFIGLSLFKPPTVIIKLDKKIKIAYLGQLQSIPLHPNLELIQLNNDQFTKTDITKYNALWINKDHYHHFLTSQGLS